MYKRSVMLENDAHPQSMTLSCRTSSLRQCSLSLRNVPRTVQHKALNQRICKVQAALETLTCVFHAIVRKGAAALISVYFF